MALFVLSFPVPKASAELQELIANVEQVLTINIPSALNFDINEIDEQWHEIPFQVGISSNNRTGYTFVSDVASSMRNPQYGKTIALDEKYSITYPAGAVKETNTHTSYPNSDNSALDKKYDYKLRVLADSHVTNGSYTGEMTFFATSNPYPATIAYIDYLDEINNDIVLTMTPGKFYQLKDRRDNKKYWIVFEDGEVKMAQNLDFDFNGTINGDYTNGLGNYTPTNNTVTGGTFEESWDYELAGPQSYDEGTIYRPSSEDAYTSISACVRDGYSEWECYRSASGNYYNWGIAHGRNSGSSSPGSVFSSDICPKNWRLPVDAEDGFLSATSPATEELWKPGKIRCIGIKPSHTLTVKVDNYYILSYDVRKSNLAWGLASFVLPNDATYMADSSHELAGWSKAPRSSTPDYVKGALYETDKTSETLYAVWKDKDLTLNDISKMQEITPTIIRKTPHGTSKQLIDARDNKKYWVTKYGGESGDIIMTQNLDFDVINTPDGIAYGSLLTDNLGSSGGSDYGSTPYSSYTGYDFEGGNVYFANGVTETSASGLAEDDERWHYHIGNYYSYSAARNGLGFTTYSTEDPYYSTSKSICPKGWGLPTVKEYERINEYYQSYNSSVPLYLLKAGGYLQSTGIITDKYSQSRYLLNDVYKSGSSSYSGTYYLHYYYFSQYNSRPYSDYYSVSYRYGSSTQNTYRYYAASVRCIARRDYNVNNPTGSRLEMRAYDKR